MLAAKLVLIDVSKMPKTHKELNDWVIDKSKEKINTIFCRFVDMISFKLSEGKNPPFDISDIERFKELKSLTPEILKRVINTKLETQYIINIFKILF